MNSEGQSFTKSATPADGAIAGLVATLPMSIVMLVLHKMLPRSEQYPLPPEQITAEIAERADIESASRGRMRDILSVFAHFSFGASVGSAFVPVARFSPLPTILTGLLYGFMVWFVSYQGWIPSARILPPASRQPARRNLMMIVAHLVWGSTLVLLLRRLAR